MTETIQPAAATVDGFPVDASTKYKLDAGKCESCGQFKTWGFKIQNKKSGKMMPGHVTAEGFKIGDGECPKWARIAEANKRKAERKVAGDAGQVQAPPKPGAWIQDITGQASAANSPSFASAPAAVAAAPAPVPVAAAGKEPGPVVAFTVNGFTFTTSVAQAAGVVEQIGAALRALLVRGA